MGFQYFGGIVGQPRLGKSADLLIEIGADAVNGSGIGTGALRLQLLEPEVLGWGWKLCLSCFSEVAFMASQLHDADGNTPRIRGREVTFCN